MKWERNTNADTNTIKIETIASRHGYHQFNAAGNLKFVLFKLYENEDLSHSLNTRHAILPRQMGYVMAYYRDVRTQRQGISTDAVLPNERNEANQN